MSIALSIHGAPEAVVAKGDSSTWIELSCQNSGGHVTLFLRGPNAAEHAEKIAEAINAARCDEGFGYG